MCVFGNNSSAPSLPPPPPPAPEPVDTTKDNAASIAARLAEEKRAKAAQGLNSTILSSPLGDTSAAPVQKATLLGLTGK